MSEAAKHTPGPWEWNRIRDTCRYLGLEGSEIVVISAEMPFGWPWVKIKNEADAQLIAAAPDLLSACKEFVRKVECGEARSKRSYSQMKVAIAKAEAKS